MGHQQSDCGNWLIKASARRAVRSLSNPELQKKFPYYKYILAGDENARRRIFHPFYADVEETFGVELNEVSDR